MTDLHKAADDLVTAIANKIDHIAYLARIDHIDAVQDYKERVLADLAALRKALAAPVVPVAWMMEWPNHSPSFTTDKSDYVSWCFGKASYPPELTPLYSHPAPVVPPGYALVPVEPTSDMKFAMAECDGWHRTDRDHPGLTRWEDYWRVALAAAPKPKEQTT